MILTLAWCVIGLLGIATLLPLIKLPLGALRSPDFLRLQLLAVTLGLALVFFYITPAGAAILVALAGVHAAHVIRFTPFWPRQSKDAGSDVDPARSISLMSVNVKQSNRAYPRLNRLIEDVDPDVVLALEVDEAWIDALETAHAAHYAHWIKVPQNNTYGLCLMSRFAPSDVFVRELVTKGIPSIRATLTLAGGDRVQLHGVHPEPPVLNHDTLGRDSEIALVGLEAKDADLPVIVVGDLNDVAWSETTRRFQRLSGLCDPRVGRGVFNTFHAGYPMLRWPLDHLFHAPSFHLVEMRRLRDIGSDHFPIAFTLVLAEDTVAERPVTPADAQERAEVKSMIREEKARTRDPIGSDWEDD